jgi:hypothetical protein
MRAATSMPLETTLFHAYIVSDSDECRTIFGAMAYYRAYTTQYMDSRSELETSREPSGSTIS